MHPSPRVLIAGIGGASLGTELLKCLLLAGGYAVWGCDVSSFAYGHYCQGFEETYLVDRERYLDAILAKCRSKAIHVVIPGGEEPMALLVQGKARFEEAGIHLASNSTEVIELCSDKQATFSTLAKLGFETPITVAPSSLNDLQGMRYPCVVKPATGGGGSSAVFLAADRAEALVYVDHLLQNEKKPIVQEYIPADEGEFTIGVLSFPDGSQAGSIALKRIFDPKLSVAAHSKSGLISSGYSQGLIDDFPQFRAIAERIAKTLRSTGPLNLQGRVRDGRLIPFEINPRFSASTYLRALAGFNEVDIYLQMMVNGVRRAPGVLKKGYYLRSFDQVFVRTDEVVT